MKNSFCAVPLMVLALVTSRAALASIPFPPALEQQLGVDSLPASSPYCTLCHRDDAGGSGTVITPFGRAVFARGAVSGNLASLEAAINQLESSGGDSDGDGASDIDELRAGTNPNEGSADQPSPLANVPLPQTGCSVNGPASAQPAFSAACLTAVWFLIARRRRAPR